MGLSESINQELTCYPSPVGQRRSQASCRLGKFDSMGFGPLTPFLEPDSFLFGQYYTGEPRNRSHVQHRVVGMICWCGSGGRRASSSVER